MTSERITPFDVTVALLEAGAIQITPEKTLLAGGGESHLYFNVGDRIISFPDQKDIVVNAFLQTYSDLGVGAKRLVGVPEGMNSLVSSLSDKSRIPQLRIREVVNKHYGVHRSVEGDYRQGDSVCIFEDVVMTGASIVRRAVDPLKDVQLKPSSVVVLIDRGYLGMNRIKAVFNSINIRAFCKAPEIIKILIDEKLVQKSAIRLLQYELDEINGR